MERGYVATTVDDIALAGRSSRSTFFRYFGAKDDVVLCRLDDIGADWVRRYRELLARDEPGDALAQALLAAVRTAAEGPRLYELMQLIVSTPALQAGLRTKIQDWRQELQSATVEHTGADPSDLGPAVLTYLVAGAASAAFTAWLRAGGGGDVVALVEASLGYARDGYTTIPVRAPAGLEGQPAGSSPR